MRIIHPSSLGATLDEVNESFFSGRSLMKPQRECAARWIADRQGMPGSYAGMFAPTDSDFGQGIRLFTGETVSTRAGIAHILGEEACRALILLGVSDAGVKDALRRASLGMKDRLLRAGTLATGAYCCGRCSVALWRCLAVGWQSHAAALLKAGVKTLKARRDGKGRWAVFPFYYTLLALSEMDSPSAAGELKYTAPSCERILKLNPTGGKFSARRRKLAENVLARC